ncbi:MAG: putative Ig domain-containing protein [Bryobacteraceae bacterium]
MIRRLAGLLALTAGTALAFTNPDGPCSITTAAALPQAVRGAAITYTFATGGCATPIRFFRAATGTLPPGMELKLDTSGGRLTGTPTAAGVYAFALRAMDLNYRIPSKSFVIRVNEPVQIDTPGAATGTAGAAYTDTIRARGGVAPYTFSIVEGALPTGLTLGAATGLITGTMPAAGAQFRVRVTDASTPPVTAERPFTIFPGGQVTTVTQPPVGSVGAVYNFDIDGSLGTGGFALALGALPTGLTINANGVIGGTPTQAGEYHFAVRQTAGTASVWRSYRILVNGTATISGAPRDAEESFAYDHVFTVSGGVAPYTFSVSAGTLPPGITLNAATGALLGELVTPSESLVSTGFTISAVDASGRTYSQAFTITDAFQLFGGAVSPPTARVNQSVASVAAYSLNGGGGGKQLGMIGGTGDGLIFIDSVTGNASYQISTPGAFTPVVLGTDALGGAVVLNTSTFNIVGNLAIQSSTQLPNARSGVPYNGQVSVVNGNFTPLNFTIPAGAGALPSGLVLNAATGAITGTPEASVGQYTFTIFVTDAVGQTANRTYAIGVGIVMQITTTSVPGGTTGTVYTTTTFTQTGGTTPVWSNPGGGLPPGLSLTSAGVLSGTPTATGSYTFLIQASQAAPTAVIDTKQFTINVAAPLTASISPPAVYEATEGFSLGATVTTGGGRAPVTLTISSGTLPEGLHLQNIAPLGIAGTARLAQTSNFTILATDADGRTASIPYTINVRKPVGILTTTLAPATRAAVYNQALAAEGGVAPYVWVVSYLSLPPGLNLSNGGVISGTPSTNGSFDFFVTVTDIHGRGNERLYTIAVTDALVITNAVPLPSGLILTAYSTPITTTGGAASKTFTISAGDLPPLLAINPATGLISNLALVSGIYNFTVRAEDSEGRVGSLAERITIGGGLAISPATLPNGAVNSPYAVTFTASNAVGAVSWLVTAGALPAGLTLNAASGLLGGTPTAPGSFNFTVQALDATGVPVTAAYTLQILNVLGITPATLPDGTVGAPYSQALTATGATGGVVWLVSAGTLPGGLTLNADTGLLSGTPTTPGLFSFTVRATDSIQQTGTRTYSIQVSGLLSIAPASLPNGNVGVAYSQPLTATGAVGAVSWTVSSGAPPTGLTLGAGTGLLSGTPTAAGVFTFTVQATDSIQQAGTRTYSIQVLGVLSVTPATLPNPTIGVAYSQTLTASGAIGAVSWLVSSGALPGGLTLNAGTGLIGGTPTAAGAFSFTVQATDSLTQTGTRAYSVQVLNTLSIAPASLPNGAVGVAYSQPLTATGATGAVAWLVSSGALPGGLTLNAGTGLIGGTPTAAGLFTFTVQATDSLTQTGTRTYSIQVLNTLSITPASLPNGTVGVAYSQPLTASGGTGAVAWLVSSGALPGGLTLNAGTGLISGTPATAGVFSFTVQATDSTAQTGTRTYSVQVLNTLSITPATLPNGSVGAAYSQTLTASGAAGAVSWLLASGTLPAGLALGTGTGLISGTPATAGVFSFTVQATDSLSQSGQQTYSLSISGVLTISPATLPNGSVGAPYNQALTAAGAAGAVTWSVTAGGLPAGLTLGAGTGLISGTPAAAGTFSFTVVATDAQGQSGVLAYSLQISGVVSISPATVPNGAVGTPYSQLLTAAGASGPVTWSIAAGALPAGLTLGAATGLIAGTPTAAGAFSFAAQATDAQSQTGSRSYSMQVLTALSVSPATLPNGTVGIAYNQALTATGAVGAVTWAVASGTLPAGLTLGAATGSISGTPTAAGSFVFAVQATDSQGQTGSRSYSVTASGILSIAPATLPNGTVGSAYSQTLTAAGAEGAVTWSVTAGALPAGLTLGAATGLLAGTPSAAGTFAFTVMAADPLGQTGARAYSITVLGVLSLSPATVPNGTVGAAYNQALTATGATGEVTWSIANGALPAGLTLGAGTGVIGGTPSAAGMFAFTVVATDSLSQTGQQSYSMRILAVLTITPATVPDGIVGTAYSQPLTATGAVAWSVASGALPPGLTLGAATGIIGGTPAAAGAFAFSVLATDSLGQSGRQAYTVTVLDVLVITTASLPEATQQEAYAAALVSSGGSSAGLAWSIAAGSLPPGLTLTAATGAISGTPSAPGTSAFTAQVANSRGQIATKALSILVIETLTITAFTLGDAVQGRAFSTTLTATGGRPPYTWSLDGTALPSGLALNPSTGQISGTTNAVEGPYPQNLAVTDARGRIARKTLALSVSVPPPPPLSIGPETLPNGRVGQVYSASFSASGGTPGYTFSVAQGGPPTGLALVAGALAGTPAQEGTFRFTVNVTDSAGRVAGNLYVVTIEPALAPLSVTPASIAPSAQVGQPFTIQFGATGGKAPYVFALSGSAPQGTSFNSSGLLSGTPSQGGAFTFSVEATDSLQAKSSRSYTVTVTGSLTITTQPPLPEGTAGKSYALTFAAAGGRAPYTWSVSGGGGPSGLTLDPAAGALSGTPAALGSFAFSVTVQDSQRLTATSSFSITIFDRLEVTGPLAGEPLVAGQSFGSAFTATGGKAPLTWSVSGGAPPAGVVLNTSTGAISGTPTTPGSFTFTVQATDALANVASATATLVVLPPLTVTTTSLPSGSVGVAYSASLAASGGVAPLGAWSITVGALPAGLTLAADGTIGGTPSAAGSTTFTVRITDARGTATLAALSIAIDLPPLPPLSILGLPQTLPPGTQINVTIQLAQPFPAAVTGTLTLVFEPNAVNNADDPAVQFSSGGRTVAFTIPAGQTMGAFPVTPLRINSGTVAGTIRIRTATTPPSAVPVPDSTVPIPRGAPVISTGTAQLGSGTFTLQIDGFSNTREISAATFRLTPVAGAPLSTTEVPVAVVTAFTTYYQSAAAAPFGGQFRLTLPFNVTGSLADIESVTVTVSNAVGASQPFTVRLR